MDFVTDDKAFEYLKSFNPKERVDFKELYPAATDDCIDFLNKTIVFNPKRRITVDEALNHDLFKKVRDKKKEVVAAEPAILSFEKEGDMDANKLRQLFIDEIKKFYKK